MKDSKNKLPWILTNIDGVVYAVSCESVLSLFQLQKVNPIPKSPAEIRGVIDFRGQIIQLVDIRRLLNLKSSQDVLDEFNTMMDDRLEDHLKWLQALEDSVVHNEEITVQTDPHMCAFGKWYDNYNANSTNIMFLMAFSKFDIPHKAIHAIGTKAKELVASNNKQAAMDLIASTRDKELKQMVGLFSDLKEAYKESKKEIVLVLGNDVRSISISVDEIVAIEYLNEVDQDLIKDTMIKSEFVIGTGKRKDDSVVLLLNDDALIDTFLDRKEAD